MAIVAIIPARYSSSRLPGKPLCDLLGRPMIQRVYERVRQARLPSKVLVATDDARIFDAVRAFGGEVVMTSPRHRSGTDRLAEVVLGMDEADIVVNVQGDEPLLDPEGIDAAARAVRDDPALDLATLSVPIFSPDEMLLPSVVKVVTDERGDACYFSRSPIPFVREGEGDLRGSAEAATARGLARKHVGLYVYRRDALLRLSALPPAPLEEAEGLEQLRALHHGMRMRVVARDAFGAQAVDTPEDLARVREILAGQAAT